MRERRPHPWGGARQGEGCAARYSLRQRAAEVVESASNRRVGLLRWGARCSGAMFRSEDPDEQRALVASDSTTCGSDGQWSEVVSKGEIRCLQTVGDMLLSGSTNVRSWDLRTGVNTHSVPMKPRTSVKDMVLQQTEERTSVWCAHSDGRVSEIVVESGSFEPRLERQFAAHRSAVSTILVTPNLEVWTGSSHGTIRCWSIDEIASAPAVRTTKLGCPFYEPDATVELEWQGSRGSDVRCLLSVESEGTVWSGSSGKGGTHV